jgi:PAS domain S-box-containing protein
MSRLLAALGATVRRDVLVKAAIVFFLGGGIASVLLRAVEVPVASPAPGAAALAWLQSRFDNLGELFLLALVVLGLVRNLGEIAEPKERKFWRRMAFAYGCWFLGAAFRFVPDLPESLPLRPFQVAFYALLYVFMICAVEGEPHRPVRPLTSAAERLLTWPAVTFFVAGLVVYFVFIPVSVHWQDLLAGAFDETANRPDEYYLYTILDVYLSLRFLFLARSADPRRWRAVYFALALPWIVLLLVADLSVLAWDTALVWPLEWTPRWWMCAPFVLQLAAVRLRHLPFPGGSPPTAGESPAPSPSLPQRQGGLLPADELSFVVSARTLALGVIFPVIHIVVTRLEIVDTPGHGARQALVLVWLVFFGAVALLQHRQLERRAQELWLDRVRFEQELRASEKDLRLIIERDRASEMVRSAEKKFDLIFRSCPYTLAVTSLEDGRFIEVNPAFEETFGYRRDEVVGRPAAELDLWLEPDAVTRLAERAGTSGPVREVEVPFRHRGGDERIAIVSTAEIRAGGEACLLSIVHDVTERRLAEKRLEAAAQVLDRAAAAIFEIGGDGRVRSWNRGAERLTGWTAEEAVGRPAADLMSAGTAWSGGEDDDVRTGEVELVRRGGEPVRLVAWCARIAGSEGASLVIAAGGSTAL